MRKLWIFGLISFLPTGAHAGDCLFHPMFIHEMEIRSCELISEANAGRVSKGASAKVVATRYPGVILEGIQKAIRQIDLEEPFTVHTWQKEDANRIFLFQAEDFNVCSAFLVGRKVKFASFTDCGCDTGPEPNGYCALTVEQVTKIPEKYLEYAK